MEPILIKYIDYANIKRNMYLITTEGLIYNSTGRVAKCFISNTGYYRINLMCEDGISRNFSVHVLVANAFLPKPKGNCVWIVNHKDGNKLHNEPSNLEWTTYKGNWEHAMNQIHTITNYGVTAYKHNPRYSEKMVYDICDLLSKRYYKANEIILLLGLVNHPEDRKSYEYRTMKKFIKNIRQRKCWKHISKNYVWADKGSSTIERVT